MKRRSVITALILGTLLFGCELPVSYQSDVESQSLPSVSTSTEAPTVTSSNYVESTITSVASTTLATVTETEILTEAATEDTNPISPVPASVDFFSLPSYTGSPYCEVNGNIPFFDISDFTTESYEYYSPLDDLGRCGECTACLGYDLMPTEPRGEIGSVRPTGFQLVRYDDVIADKYLFNRCHVLGWQLTGENANERNLITGTRYMNVEGMLPFENKVAKYIKRTNNHVLYRVTPIFIESELVCRGVLMEAQSVEDDGSGIRFNVFCYNVQPQIYIDYSNGDNHLIEETFIPIATVTDIPTDERIIEDPQPESQTYILNTNTRKFHYPSCSSVDSMKEKNKLEYNGTRDEIIAQGYEPCKRCNP